MKVLTATILSLIILLATAYFSIFIVQENEIVIMTRFGKPTRIIDSSGLYLKLPGLLDTVNRFDKRADLFATQPTQLLLGDKKPIIVSCYILWEIHDPLVFFSLLEK